MCSIACWQCWVHVCAPKVCLLLAVPCMFKAQRWRFILYLLCSICEDLGNSSHVHTTGANAQGAHNLPMNSQGEVFR